jgi:hypothetical protein
MEALHAASFWPLRAGSPSHIQIATVRQGLVPAAGSQETPTDIPGSRRKCSFPPSNTDKKTQKLTKRSRTVQFGIGAKFYNLFAPQDLRRLARQLILRIKGSAINLDEIQSPKRIQIPGVQMTQAKAHRGGRRASGRLSIWVWDLFRPCGADFGFRQPVKHV